MSEGTISTVSGKSGATRQFSPAMASALSAAASKYSQDPFDGDEPLRTAIVEAVSEAHAQGWTGDELLAALRSATSIENLPPPQRDALETTIRRRALVSFFGAKDAGW